MKTIKMIIGLGNKGNKYKFNRHNLGFMVIDALSKAYNVKLTKKNYAEIGYINNVINVINVIIIVKPHSYMNTVGGVVKKLLEEYNLTKDEILIVLDDIDLELGQIKIKKKGSAAGHKGLLSIINTIGSEEFSRLRIGIDRPADKIYIKEYVLSNFSEEELITIKRAIEVAIISINHIIAHGIDKAISCSWTIKDH